MSPLHPSPFAQHFIRISSYCASQPANPNHRLTDKMHRAVSGSAFYSNSFSLVLPRAGTVSDWLVCHVPLGGFPFQEALCEASANQGLFSRDQPVPWLACRTEYFLRFFIEILFFLIALLHPLSTNALRRRMRQAHLLITEWRLT